MLFSGLAYAAATLCCGEKSDGRGRETGGRRPSRTGYYAKQTTAKPFTLPIATVDLMRDQDLEKAGAEVDVLRRETINGPTCGVPISGWVKKG